MIVRRNVARSRTPPLSMTPSIQPELSCLISATDGLSITRILDRLSIQRDLPSAIRIDNGKEFCGRAMLAWAHQHGVALFLIKHRKTNQNAYIESFNGRFRDKCLNGHWFTNLHHARAIIEAW